MLRKGGALNLCKAQRLLDEAVRREMHKEGHVTEIITDYEQVKHKPTKKTGIKFMQYAIRKLAPRGREVISALYQGWSSTELATEFGVNKVYMGMYLKACGWTTPHSQWGLCKWVHYDGTEIHITGRKYAESKEIPEPTSVLSNLGYMQEHRRWIQHGVEHNHSPEKICANYRNLYPASLCEFVAMEMKLEWCEPLQKWCRV